MAGSALPGAGASGLLERGSPRSSSAAAPRRVWRRKFPPAIDLIGQTGFGDLADLARAARFAVGNDTGPMHLIATAGCPAITLFSNDSNPSQCAPVGRWTRILQRPDLADLPVEAVLESLPPDAGSVPLPRATRPCVPADGVPMPQRMWAILTIGLGLTLAVLDGGIANVALPTIAREVNTSPANSIWVVNAYQLAVTISLLPLSSLGEIYGYRRIYQIGLVLFTIASLFCALSSSLPTLIIARMLQGFGAAGIMSVNSALIRFIYPRRWLGRGVGLNATVGSIASAVGPSVASAILAVAPWPWLFSVNVPLGLVAGISRCGPCR